jgi:F-type H+-transporting ATPase subunit b
MRRWGGFLVAALLVTGLAAGQHEDTREHQQTEQSTQDGHAATNGAQEHAGEEHADDSQLWWKWANFALLAAALGYVIRKHGGTFFQGRTAEIRKGIQDAERMRAQAEARMSEVEARLANLGVEVAALRASAAQEHTAEAERVRQQTVADLDKVRARAQQEIEAAGKAARLDLKRHSAEVSLQLAEQKIRRRMTPQAQDALFQNFVRKLPQPPAAFKQ